MLKTKIIFGKGSISKVGEEAQCLGKNKIFIIADPFIITTESFQLLTNGLDKTGNQYQIFYEVEPEPQVDLVEKVCKRLLDYGAELIVAIGGGSCMDSAKAVGVLATNPGKLQNYAGWDKFHNQPIPIIAIPTTAGTGSEITDAAVITDKEENIKFTIKHAKYNRPMAAILDPDVLKTVPKNLAITTGFDALAHAVEAYTSLKSTPYLDAFSLKAIEMIGKHFRTFIENRSNSEAAAGMLIASNMAGIAFPIAGTGNCHCIARFIGGHHTISHGMCCSIILPHVVEFNYAHSPQKFKNIANALGKHTTGKDQREDAYQGVLAIKELAADLKLPRTITEYDQEIQLDVELLAEQCCKSWYNEFNPRYTSKEDFINLIANITKA
ncbi:iron-containing alcohol dehydrogenase [Desulfitibacter alkalitolerans]|uniref:iron-containing alcohol dehydrogenase n=1 Tax=Desulfitibacter alkalitolerans TaxID=264641 RepID=UPI00146FAD19|nr:iron-containing alcohol dehydrogenase [Desulfitibacter alkalitolerans]